MSFKNGHKKIGGRKKGTLNKRTEQRLKKIEEIIKLLEQGLTKDIKQIRGVDRVNLWEDLQEYILPKQQRANQEGDQDININIHVDRDDANV